MFFISNLSYIRITKYEKNIVLTYYKNIKYNKQVYGKAKQNYDKNWG